MVCALGRRAMKCPAFKSPDLDFMSSFAVALLKRNKKTESLLICCTTSNQTAARCKQAVSAPPRPPV